SGVTWIAVLAALLGGIVALNVAVLQLNVRLSSLSRERASLRSENASLQSQLSSEAATPRIQALARKRLGLVPAPTDATMFVASAAAQALGLNAQQLYAQLVDRKRSFVYVERKADTEHALPLEKRHLAGLYFYPEERRWYPQSSVAAHVLGFAGIDNRGLAGL